MESNSKVAIWFKAFMAIAIIWNIFGLLVYIGHAFVGPEELEAMTETERETFLHTPAWTYAAFALAVFGGLFGSILLLFRRSAAYILLWLSLLGILVTEYYNFFYIDSIALYGTMPIILESLVLFFGIALIQVYRIAKGKNWIIS